MTACFFWMYRPCCVIFSVGCYLFLTFFFPAIFLPTALALILCCCSFYFLWFRFCIVDDSARKKQACIKWCLMVHGLVMSRFSFCFDRKLFYLRSFFTKCMTIKRCFHFGRFLFSFCHPLSQAAVSMFFTLIVCFFWACSFKIDNWVSFQIETQRNWNYVLNPW